jgi:streptomycin 6-kinase
MNPEFVRNIVAFKGEEGQAWLDSIPETIKEYEEKWSMHVLSPFHLSYNYVAPAVRANGEHVVFKIGIPGENEFRTELEALRTFDGQGMAKLLDEDLEQNIMLIERVEPGIPVSAIEDDNEATRVIASIMRELHHHTPDDATFPTLSDWYRGFARLKAQFEGKTGPIPEKLFTEAEELYQHLIDTSTETYLLHGDLHHDNVLSSHREPYLAIDPQGVIGERAHEAGAMLRNPQKKLHEFPDLKAVLERRIAILSDELGIDRERIRQWGVAQTVLSAIWKVEDKGADVHYCVTTAETLSELKV